MTHESVINGGSALETTVSSGGTLEVDSGGYASGTTVSSGGGLMLVDNGSADATTLLPGATMLIGSGATFTDFQISSGITLDVSSGGIVSSAIIDSGGSETVSAGGSDVSALMSGGTQDIYGSGSGTVLDGFAVQIVEAGGAARGTIVEATDSQVVENGGTTFDTIVSSGGVEIVSAGGTASNTTVSNGGTLELIGMAPPPSDGLDTIVSNGGVEIVSSGGMADSTAVLGGGNEIVSAGGSAFTTTLSGYTVGSDTVYGRETVLSGAFMGGPIVIKGGGLLDVPSGTAVDVHFQGAGTFEIDGANSGDVVPNPVFGFAPGDDFYLPDVPYDSSGTVSLGAGNWLFISENGNSYSIPLDPGQSFAGDYFHLGSGTPGGTRVYDDTTPCYCRGTRILTPHGEVPVEELKIGDEVTTLLGEAKRVRWIGHRAYDGRFITGNRNILPIRIAANAIADGMPARDLWVSPRHSLYIGGVLVQSEHIVNGMTIAQAEKVETVEYFHIELDAHDVVFAEGAPAETFVDCDNRLMFSNGVEYAPLYPSDKRPSWAFCAPRLEWGDEALSEIRARLLQRADAFGYALDQDPDLHLIIDGEIARPVSDTGGVYRFEIPAGATSVWLASRSTVPAEIVPESRDIRRLGVPVERIVLADADLSIEAWHGHAGLTEGFHEDEQQHRWTDGLAGLPEALLRPFGAGCTLDVHLMPSELRYRVEAPEPRQANIVKRQARR